MTGTSSNSPTPMLMRFAAVLCWCSECNLVSDLLRQLGDCHDLRCLKEWYPQANNITLSKYAFELNEIFAPETVQKFPAWEMGLFGHSPDTGNEWDFYPSTNKTANATMFGFDGSCMCFGIGRRSRSLSHSHDDHRSQQRLSRGPFSAPSAHPAPHPSRVCDLARRPNTARHVSAWARVVPDTPVLTRGVCERYASGSGVRI